MSEERTVNVSLDFYKHMFTNLLKVMCLEGEGLKDWTGYKSAMIRHSEILEEYLSAIEKEQGFKFDE